MPTTQPNGSKSGTSDQHMGHITGFSYTINFTNCDSNRGAGPSGTSAAVLNPNIDYFTPYYIDPINHTPSEVGDGTLRPQFIVVTVYNDHKNPWLEGRLNNNHIRFEFRSNDGNYPFNPVSYTGTHSAIADGIALPVNDSYFTTSNPWSTNMFHSVGGKNSNDLLAAQMHPGYKSSWNASNLTWAKQRTFLTKTPALGAPLDVSDGFAGSNDEPRYLSFRMQYYDSFTSQWLATPWEEYGALVNNNISSTRQLFINDGGYEHPIHKGLHLPQMTAANKGWLPAGTGLTHGDNLFNSNLADKQVFTLNGAINEVNPVSAPWIDILRQHAHNSWNNGVGTNCLQWDIGGNVDGLYRKRMAGTRAGGITYNSIVSSTNMIGMTAAYAGQSGATCTNNTYVDNVSSGNSMYHLDLDQFYMCTEVCPSIIEYGTFSPAYSGAGNAQFGSNMIMYNSPKCENATFWKSNLMYFALIPAPISAGNSKDTLVVQTRSGNSKGYDTLYVNAPAQANFLSCDTSTILYHSDNTMAVGTFTDWDVIEPKSQCRYEVRGHEAIYAVSLFNINLKKTNLTCASNGTLRCEFQYSYGPDWASKGPSTWSIPIKFKIWDNSNNSYIFIYFTIDENTSGGPQSTANTTAGPGVYALTLLDVGPVISTEYYNDAGEMFDGYGQVNYGAYSPNDSVTITGAYTNFTPTVTGTNVSCFGGSDGTITASTSGAGFTSPVTVTLTPGSGGAGTTVLGPSNGSTFAFTNLTGGTYTIDYLDGATCTYSDSFTVTEPNAAMGVTSTSTPTSYCISTNGTITLTPSGGTAPYSVVYTMPNGIINLTTGTSLINAMPGTWSWVVTDSSGCGAVSGVTVVANAGNSGIGQVLSWMDPTTPGGTDGTLDIFVAGQNQVTCNVGLNTPSVSWTTTATTGNQGSTNTTCTPWAPGNTLLQYTGLAAGTITVDACFNGCCYTRVIVLVGASALTATATANIIPCNTPSAGVITITASGGSVSSFHHYEYTLCTDVGMTTACIGPQLSDTFSNLSAGTYYATVTDWFDPTGTTQGQTSAVVAITITALSAGNFGWTLTHPTCVGADGKIVLASATGGLAPYQYFTTDSNGTVLGPFSMSPPTDFFSRAAGSHTLTVVDANGCEDATIVTLIDPPAIVVGTTTPTVATCGVNNNGTIVITSAWTGGTGTLTYNLYDNGGTLLSSNTTGATFTNLSSGTYTLTVVDDNGCDSTSTIFVALTSITLTSSKSDQSCNYPPSNDGSINLTLVGNIGTTTYAWTGTGGYTATTEDIANLPVGVYDVTVTDSNGCTGTLTGISILQSSDTLETVIVSGIASACPGGCSGVVVDVNGGDFPLLLEVSEDGGATWTQVASTASSAAAQFNENAPAPFFGPIGITINNANYFKANTTNRYCFIDSVTYKFRTKSVINSCYSNVMSHTPSASTYIPMTLIETLTQPSCCSCNNASCSGIINVVINNGVPIAQGAAGTPGVLSYDWILEKDGVDITAFVTYQVGFSGGGTNIEFNTITFTGLYPGSYELITTDDCGEIMTETYIVLDPRIYITDIVTTDQLCLNGCQDGTIEITATGGSSGTLQYSINDGITFQASNIFTGVGQGTWRVWVRDPGCGSQILFDPSDNVLTGANGCYSDFIPGVWPTGTEASLTSSSALDLQLISTTHNSFPGSSDGELVVNITAGTAPYEISIVTAATSTTFDSCISQTGVTLTSGLSQYININGASVSNTGITSLASNGTVTIDNLSVAQNWSSSALNAWYRVTIKDALGCFSSVESEIDNGTLGVIGIYGATNCDCSCPSGYALITPPPISGLPCVGLIDVAPIDNGIINATNTIQQFGGANTYVGQYGNPNGGVLYVDSVTNSATVFVASGDAFYKTSGGGWPAPYNMSFSGTSTILIAAVDSGLNVIQYGSIFNTRLLDAGVWLMQGPSVPALPVNEWIGIPIEVNFSSHANTILGIACHGNYRVSLDCALLLTSESIGGTQSSQVDTNNMSEYSMFPITIPAGHHTILIEVKNSTANTAGQPAGIAFDLFQGELSSGLSVTSVFSTATSQPTLDLYHLTDVNGKPITSFDSTNGNYDHPFKLGATDGFSCISGCVKMNGGVLTCQSDDTASCDLPINCPEYLIDLVECTGTLANVVHNKMVSGLLKNNLSTKDVWQVIIIKYLINHLNPCVTMQDLLSWTKFLEDVCPDCEDSVTISPPPVDEGTPFGGVTLTEFDF
jgi:hypothetical protein